MSHRRDREETRPARAFARRISPQPLAAKVPEIGFLFWVVKLLTTAGGEAASDSLSHNIPVGVAVDLFLIVTALFFQFRTRRYVAIAYWYLALAIATFGTGAADVLHLDLGLPYTVTTLLWAVVLGVVFWRWYRSEGTLSIHSIVTRRREGYYWATVFATFALGTALGDLTAITLHLGYLGSGIMFAVIIAVPAIAWRMGLNPVAAFWSAYIVTRPLGASFADYFSKPRALSGLNFGDLPTTAVFVVAIVALVGYLQVTRRDIQPAAVEAERVWPRDPSPAA
ncbi:MAG TPA: hypothetical protein VG268_08910 [Streptosporangiaceae bacterium]|nr:hypothetical protein [Streptosporangiaceae bacterium]